MVDNVEGVRQTV